MSAKKRRIKRKLAQLVRMDADLFRRWRLDREKALVIIACMKTRGRWLRRHGKFSLAVGVMLSARRLRGQSAGDLGP